MWYEPSTRVALEVDHRVAGQDAFGHGSRAAPSRRRGCTAWARRRRRSGRRTRSRSPCGAGLELDDHVAELSMAAGLALESVVDLGRLADRLAVRDPWRCRSSPPRRTCASGAPRARRRGRRPWRSGSSRRCRPREWIRAQGSSSSIRDRAWPSLSRSALDSGSMADLEGRRREVQRREAGPPRRGRPPACRRSGCSPAWRPPRCHPGPACGMFTCSLPSRPRMLPIRSSALCGSRSRGGPAP